MSNTVELYREIMDIADRLDEIRFELWNNKEHQNNFIIYEEGYKDFDNKMFTLQIKVRNLVSDELEFYGIETREEKLLRYYKKYSKDMEKCNPSFKELIKVIKEINEPPSIF